MNTYVTPYSFFLLLALVFCFTPTKGFAINSVQEITVHDRKSAKAPRSHKKKKNRRLQSIHEAFSGKKFRVLKRAARSNIDFDWLYALSIFLFALACAILILSIVLAVLTWPFRRTNNDTIAVILYIFFGLSLFFIAISTSLIVKGIRAMKSRGASLFI